jgi:uroporphyrinogen decarboxylase
MKQQTMSERENFIRSIEFNYPQWVPITVEFVPALLKKHPAEIESIIEGHPLVFPGGPKEFDEDDPLFIEGAHFTDDWGCGWYCAQDGIIGRCIEHPLENWEALNDYRAPNPLEQMDWKELKRALDEDVNTGLPAIGFPESYSQVGFFDRLQFLRGMENLLVDMMSGAQQLDRLIEIVLDYNMSYIHKYLQLKPDILWFHGDIGSQHGLIFSPDLFRKYLKPAYMEMFQTCREAGVHVWYSSDGNLLELVEDLIECGVSFHDPQVRANTVDGIVKAYKDKLCAMIDIDQQMLPFCTSLDVRNQIKEIVEKMGSPRGGFQIFAAPSADVPLENIEAICEAWEEYCFYHWP